MKMGRNEAGHTWIELIVSVLMMGIVILLMMPSLSGYVQSISSNNPNTPNTTTGVAAIRALGEQIVSDARQAQQDADTEGQNIVWNVAYDFPPYSISFSNPSGGQISKVNLAPTMNVTAVCYGGHFSPQGWARPNCSAGATFDLICFDSNTPGSPFGFMVTVVAATGQIIGEPTQGKCP